MDPTPAGRWTAPPEGDPTVEFEVVHDDAEVIVVDKPAGLVVHPGAGHPGGTLVNGLLARYPELAGLRGGGGRRRAPARASCTVSTAAPPACWWWPGRPTPTSSLVAQLRDRRVSRRYQALVLGRGGRRIRCGRRPHRALGELRPTRMAVSRKGRTARTRYRGGAAVQPPGRGHLARRGRSTPAGPTRSGSIWRPSAIRWSGTRSTGGVERLPGSTLNRPFLHAAALAFEHPATGRPVSFESPLPEDLRLELEALEPMDGRSAPDGLRRPGGRLRACRSRRGPPVPRPRPGAPCAPRSRAARPSSATRPGRSRRSRSDGG